MLLLLGLAATGILAAKPRTRWLAMAAAGSLAAALTLIKINIGIFAILAVALAVLVPVASPPGSGVRQNTRPAPARSCCPSRSCGHTSTIRRRRRIVSSSPLPSPEFWPVPPGFAQTGTFSSRECLAAVAGFAVTFALVLLILVWQGVPMRATLNMLVLDHIRINVSQGFWYQRRRTGPDLDCVGNSGLSAPPYWFPAPCAGAPETCHRLLAPFQVLFGGIGLLMASFAPAPPARFCHAVLLAADVPAAGSMRRGKLTREFSSVPWQCCRRCMPTRLPAARLTSCESCWFVVAAVSLLDGLHSLRQPARLVGDGPEASPGPRPLSLWPR